MAVRLKKIFRVFEGEKALLFIFCVLLAMGLLGSRLAKAQVISPSGREVRATFTASFLVREGEEALELLKLSEDHAQHMFGIFHSPELSKELGLDPEVKTGGFAAPKQPYEIEIKNQEWVEVEHPDEVDPSKSNKVERLRLTYRAQTKLIMEKTVAAKLLKRRKRGLLWELQLPYDLSLVYKKECTDEHYPDLGDYWYFWDPYRPQCKELLSEPFTKKVPVSLVSVDAKPTETSANFDDLRGDNGNGDLLQIGVIQGYSEGAGAPGDEGKKNFQELNRALKDLGFAETISKKVKNSPLHVFTKTVPNRNDPLGNARKIDVEIHHRLVNTDIVSDTITFARDFQKMSKSFDVVIYEGHSGLGGNLDLPSLEMKLKKKKSGVVLENGDIEFPQNKRQVFLFDSCASYSYFLDPFRQEKEKKSKIDIITNGLSSYFAYATPVLLKFLNRVIEGPSHLTWLTVLTEMEEPLEGDTYLINVGGV